MEGLAHTVIRFRFAVILAWVVVAAFAVPRAARVAEVLSVEGHSLKPTESSEVTATIRAAFERPISKFIAVTVSGPVPIDSQPFRTLLQDLSDAALREPYIDQVISYLTTPDSGLVSSDRRTTFLIASVGVSHADTVTRAVPAFRAAIHGAAARHPRASQYEIFVTGEPALDYDARSVSAEDAQRAETRSLIPTSMVLVLAFGAIVAAILPVIIGMFAISCAAAGVHVVGSFYPMSVFAITIITMVGLAVGIDYSLLIVTRFREEMNRGLSARDAAVRSISTAGRAVITSGLTVLIGFASLLITPITETRSVGIGGLLVVGIAVLLAVTLLPAVLSVLGRRIDWPRWLARRLAWYHTPRGWERWARWLAHHPWRALTIGITLIAAITWPIAKIKIGLPRAGWFPPGTESTYGADALERIGSRGSLLPIRVTLQAPEGQRVVGTRYIRGLKRFSDSVQADPRVSQIRGPVDIQPGMSAFRYSMLYSDLTSARERYPEFFKAYISADGRTTLMDVILSDTASFAEAMDVVHYVRTIAPSVRGLDSVSIKVGGFAASSLDLQENLLASFPTVIILVVIVTAVMLLIAFQSVLVPIKAVVMNGLSVLGAFGLLVLVFQEGVGVGIFGLAQATGAVYVVVPVLVFAVVFGLSMDYEVFLLSRIKEAYDRTKKNDVATMEGLSVTASVITSAAAIMMIVFGTFAFSRVLAAQLLGFGLAVAVFLDATLIRMVLVPAVMHIAGGWNWWPGVRSTGASKEQIPSRPPAYTPDGSSATPIHTGSGEVKSDV